jgi:hypothetical protein
MDKRHLFTKGRRQIRHIGRFKKYFTNFDARRRILHIRANEALALSSLVPQIMRSCTNILILSLYLYFRCSRDYLLTFLNILFNESISLLPLLILFSISSSSSSSQEFIDFCFCVEFAVWFIDCCFLFHY